MLMAKHERTEYLLGLLFLSRVPVLYVCQSYFYLLHNSCLYPWDMLSVEETHLESWPRLYIMMSQI